MTHRPDTPPRADGPLFLERQTYRRRRAVDAVRMVPVLGTVLFLVPLLWPKGDMSTSGAMIFLFAVWLGLSVLCWALSRVLSRGLSGEGNAEVAADRTQHDTRSDAP